MEHLAHILDHRGRGQHRRQRQTPPEAPAAGGPAHLLDELGQRARPRAGDDHALAHRLRPLAGREERRDHVLDVHHVPAAPAIAEQREASLAHAPEQLQEPLVARPIDVGGPEDRVRHLGGGSQLPHHPLGRHLGPLVDVPGPERARLGRDSRGAVAVDPDRPAIHEPLDPRGPRSFEQPLRPIEVHPLEELIALPALAHRDGEMEDMGDPTNRPLAELRGP